MLESMKQEVLNYAKQSFSEKLFAGTSGNLSVYDPQSGVMVITPGSVDYMSMQLDEVIVMKLDGTVLEGVGKPSSEWRMHAAVYREKADVRAIVHTHSPYATGFAVVNQEIPVILIEMLPFLGGNVRVASFAIPGTDAVGTEAVKALDNRLCCLLQNHGVLSIGPDMLHAHKTAIYVEDAARVYTYAKRLGEPIKIEGDLLRRMREKYHLPAEN